MCKHFAKMRKNTTKLCKNTQNFAIFFLKIQKISTDGVPRFFRLCITLHNNIWAFITMYVNLQISIYNPEYQNFIAWTLVYNSVDQYIWHCRSTFIALQISVYNPTVPAGTLLPNKSKLSRADKKKIAQICEAKFWGSETQVK